MEDVPELLAPAGNLEKLKIAVLYGADAVYVGGELYNLREAADNFTIEDLQEGLEFAHKRGVKVYVTVNMIPHNENLKDLPEYIAKLDGIGVDAVIVADPGVLSIVREAAPEMEIHLSTQANNVNWRSLQFWQKQGVERVILARELSINEMKEINKRVDVDTEAFIHGAMCISYSGRCLLSNYMINRDANRGECAQSCRWEYTLMEAERPGEYHPIVEDENGTYIFNSKDLCMIEHIPELMATGVSSFKIEGRMKSLHYVATVVNTYRQALDEWAEDPENYTFKEEWLDELKKISHRHYTTGFYFDQPGAEGQNYETSSYVRDYDFMGIVQEYLPETEEAVIEVRSKFFEGDEVEIFGPKTDSFIEELEYIKNEEGERILDAPHPHQLITVKVEEPVEKYDLVRREKRDE
ncbi:peptidase U32 family protein [Acetohalobium arabaticum]|uniref:Peptidase U32 n=1 Tax=Acetohalobium arabaticum (strain ATCC 49924 / DSM 5501 / Z-7288) TaxID=574087 RepID=D9QUQ7_ACEAZ|nr:U32 family peptidase [Acetohalobium arabaticum]ADL11966.1 peptidase U32 [Acetohalobium arabaticum DSM 5501]